MFKLLAIQVGLSWSWDVSTLLSLHFVVLVMSTFFLSLPLSVHSNVATPELLSSFYPFVCSSRRGNYMFSTALYSCRAHLCPTKEMV